MAKWLLTLLLILLPSLAFAQFDSVVIRDPTTGQGACVNPDGTLCTSGGGGGGGTVDQGTGGMSPWAVQFLTPQSIVGTVTANSAAATTATGSLSADGSTVEFTIPAGTSTVSMYATGNTTPGEGFFLEFSQDGTNWGTLAYIANDNLNRYLDGNGTFFNGVDAEMSILPQTFWFNTAGIQKIRMRQGLGVPLTTPIDLTYRAHPNTLAVVAVNGPSLDAAVVELTGISSNTLQALSLHADFSDQGALFDGVNDEIASILTYPGTVAFSVAGGLVGTVVFECRMSAFHPWEAVNAVLTTRAQVANVSSFPATGIFAGGQNFGECRIRVSAYSSGSSLARLVQVRPGNASVNANAYLIDPTGTFIGTATAPIRIDPTGTTPQPVSATNLDTRDLTFAQDKVDVSGSTVAVTLPGATTAAGLIDATNETVEITLTSPGPVGVTLTGTAADGDTLVFERTFDGTNWFPWPVFRCAMPGFTCVDNSVYHDWAATSYVQLPSFSDDYPQGFSSNPGAAVKFRVRGSMITTSSTTVALRTIPGTADVTAIRGKVQTSGFESSIAAWIADSAGTSVTLGQKTMAASLPVVIASDQLPAAAALADNTANPTTTRVGSFLHVFDGVTWDRLRGDSTDGALVNLGANNDVTITSSTSLTPGTAAANLGKAEDAGVGSGDTGVTPLLRRCDGGGTLLTTADVEYTHQCADGYGAAYARVDNPNRLKCQISSTATTSAVVTGCGAPGAGLSIYITSLQWSSSIISTTTNFMTIQDGTGGNCGANVTVHYQGYALAFTSVTVVFQTPIKADANSEICLLHPGAGTRLVNIQGFIAP